jgi:hypothetical protein
MENSFDVKIKAWISPILITVFGVMSWSLISEIRSDVKMLLKSSAQYEIRIGNLESRMTKNEPLIYTERLFAIKPEEIKIPKREELN